MHSMTAEEAVERLLAIQYEGGYGTVEESHHESEHQAREIRNHVSSLVIAMRISIGRRA